MLIEYPPGSGVTADYTDVERAFMREIVGDAESGAITAEECGRVLAFIHDAKVLLDARIVSPPEPEPFFTAPEQTALHLPDPDSPFQIPGKAREKLGLPAYQRG